MHSDTFCPTNVHSYAFCVHRQGANVHSDAFCPTFAFGARALKLRSAPSDSTCSTKKGLRRHMDQDQDGVSGRQRIETKDQKQK